MQKANLPTVVSKLAWEVRAGKAMATSFGT